MVRVTLMRVYMSAKINKKETNLVGIIVVDGCVITHGGKNQTNKQKRDGVYCAVEIVCEIPFRRACGVWWGLFLAGKGLLKDGVQVETI